jgi:hypothetical protein
VRERGGGEESLFGRCIVCCFFLFLIDAFAVIFLIVCTLILDTCVSAREREERAEVYG